MFTVPRQRCGSRASPSSSSPCASSSASRSYPRCSSPSPRAGSSSARCLEPRLHSPSSPHMADGADAAPDGGLNTELPGEECEGGVGLGGGLNEMQRRERVIAYEESTYGFVRLAVAALRGAGMMPPPPADGALSACDGRLSSLLQQLHVSAPARALTAQGPRCERHISPARCCARLASRTNRLT